MKKKVVRKTIKPAKKRSGKTAASIAGRYLEMSDWQLMVHIMKCTASKIKSVEQLSKDIRTMAGSVVSQREK